MLRCRCHVAIEAAEVVHIVHHVRAGLFGLVGEKLSCVLALLVDNATGSFNEIFPRLLRSDRGHDAYHRFPRALLRSFELSHKCCWLSSASL